MTSIEDLVLAKAETGAVLERANDAVLVAEQKLAEAAERDREAHRALMAAVHGLVEAAGRVETLPPAGD